MTLTKTTVNFAVKRGLELDVHDFDGATIIDLFELDGGYCEPMCQFHLNADGSITWRGNIYLRTDIKEEVPAYCADETAFRKVLAFIANEIKK